MFPGADHYMHQRQQYSSLFGWSYPFPMILRLVDSVKTRQRICFYDLSSFKVFGKKLVNGYFGDTINSMHSGKTSPLLTSFHSNKNWSFALSSPASFASTFSANKSVVKLNHVFKPIDAVPVSHSFSDLTEHVLCGNPGNTKVFSDAKSRNTSFVRSKEMTAVQIPDQRLIDRRIGVLEA